MTAALLPCPFCGSVARETTETDLDYPIKRFMFIQCTRCAARTGSIYGSGEPSEWADARQSWNNRSARTLPASDTITLGAIETTEAGVPSFTEVCRG